MAKQSPNPTIPSADVTAAKFIPLINEITDEVSYATLAQVAAAAAATSSNVGVFVPFTELVNVVAASGAAQTIPAPSVKPNTRLVLTANCTLTFPTAAAGLSLRIVVVQDATPRTLTFPAAVKWPGGTPPTLSAGAAAVDQFAFRCYDGTNWLGTVVGQAYG